MGQMIVTCDHCGTRYKLDEAKIPGRGARVTCPSCKHVFVVYRKPEGALNAAASAPPPAAPSRPSIDEEIAGLDPDNLDFRSVGIASWKVKVKIGLVYDFNDFKTIDKYIREGRVSGSDLLSHDGESWLPIEEISDLRNHFCEVFVRARRALETPDDEDDDFSEEEPTRIMQGSPAIVAASKPTNIGAAAAAPAPAPEPTPKLSTGAGDLDFAAAIADASADVDAQSGKQPVGPRFVDPFEAKRNARANNKTRSSGEPRRPKPRPKKKGAGTKPPEGGGSGRLILIAAVTLAVVFGGLYYTTLRKSDAASTPRVPATDRGKATDPAPEPAGANDIKPEDLLEEILDQGDPVTEPEEPVDPTVDEFGDKILIPVGPDEQRSGTQDDGLNGGSYDVGDKSAAEFASAGQIDLRNRSWSSAARNYAKASQMAPGNASYAEGHGEALKRSGNTSQARAVLERARGLGSRRALHLLGDIAAADGDAAGAKRYYQDYLATNPSASERAEVERKLSQIRR